MDNVAGHISLNRSEILPKSSVDKYCPTFVLDFLAKSLSIKVDEDLTDWDKVENAISRVSIDHKESFHWNCHESGFPSAETLVQMAGFVNPDCDWNDESTLIKSFWDSYNYTPIIPVSADTQFCRKNPDSDVGIDEIMVYQLCLRYGIKTNRESNIDALVKEIKNLSVHLTPMRQDIFHRIMRMGRKGLIGIKNHFSTSADIFPDTPQSAIEYCASEYRWDIKESTNPFAELRQLEGSSQSLEYSPWDHNLSRRFNCNPHYYYLDSRYIGEYNFLYSSAQRESLKYLSGWDPSYTNLSNLIIGLHPDLNDIKKTTILHEEISDKSSQRYKDIISSKAFVFNRDEIHDYWKSRWDFTTPINTSEEFSPSDLRMVLRNSRGHKVVDLVRNIHSHRKETIVSAICKLFKESTCVLTDLEELGFMMRGWKTAYSIENIPITESTYDTEKYQDLIEEKTIAKITDIKETHVGLLDFVPLMIARKYYTGDNSVIVPYGKDVSVSDRLNLVLEKPTHIHACIRTSSNLLLTTSWFFMNKIGITPRFSLDDLRHIS